VLDQPNPAEHPDANYAVQSEITNFHVFDELPRDGEQRFPEAIYSTNDIDYSIATEHHAFSWQNCSDLHTLPFKILVVEQRAFSEVVVL
jgi:hypothetical protein